MPWKSRPITAYPAAHMATPTATLTRMRKVKSSRASSGFCSPIFFMMAALPPVASMVEMAVTN